jgi:hypothetical protein
VSLCTKHASERQAVSNRPQYFIYLKNGRLRPVDVLPGTLAVQHRGRWHVVFRGVTDEEYFAAHPDMPPFRLTTRRSPNFRRDYFEFRVVTRDPKVYAEGDKWDAFSDLGLRPGTNRERLIRACLKMLTDPHRLSPKGSHRLMDDPEWRERHDMTDADLWRLAMRVIEPEATRQ